MVKKDQSMEKEIQTYRDELKKVNQQLSQEKEISTKEQEMIVADRQKMT